MDVADVNKEDGADPLSLAVFPAPTPSAAVAQLDVHIDRMALENINIAFNKKDAQEQMDNKDAERLGAVCSPLFS